MKPYIKGQYWMITTIALDDNYVQYNWMITTSW